MKTEVHGVLERRQGRWLHSQHVKPIAHGWKALGTARSRGSWRGVAGLPGDTRSHLWLALVLSIAIHGAILATLVVESKRAPLFHPVIYGVGGDPPVVRFVSVTGDGSSGGAAVQDGAPRVPGDGLSSSVPPPVEPSEGLPLEKSLAVEPLTIQIDAAEETQLAGASGTEVLQMEPTSAIATIADRSNTGEGAHGSVDGQGNGGSQDGTGPGRSGGGSGGGSARPAYLRNPPPPYPRVAREHGWEGATLLQVEVMDDGSGGKVEVLRSSGYQVLDEAAMETVRRWKFLPARSGDTPIRSLVEIPIRFRIADN